MKVLRLTPHYYYTPDVVNGWIVRLDQMGGMQTQIYRQSIALAKKNVKQIILPIAMPSAPKEWKPHKGIRVIKGNIPMLPIKSKVRGTVGLNVYWGIGVLKHITLHLHIAFRRINNIQKLSKFNNTIRIVYDVV